MIALIARAVSVLSGAVLAAAIVALALLLAVRQPGPLEADTTVLIPPGSGVSTMVALLDRAGVVEDPWRFRLMIIVSGRDRSLQAGEYRFPAAVSAWDALAMLSAGRTADHLLTVPEGLSRHEIVALLDAEARLVGTIDDLPPEGGLLPESYRFTRGSQRQALLDRMTAAMADTLAEVWADRADGLPFDTPEEAVVLASIIEKETGRPEERALIAGVFVNRLQRGMPLQSDPTVIFALTEGRDRLGRPLTRADLRVESPYNTYGSRGLPPGPICNPGRAALEAAVRPEHTDYLYFVADGSGGHAFAETLEEHNRNAARWHRLNDGG